MSQRELYLDVFESALAAAKKKPAGLSRTDVQKLVNEAFWDVIETNRQIQLGYARQKAQAIVEMVEEALETGKPVRERFASYCYDRRVASKKVRLSPKELARADSGYTVVVRQQADGGFMVAAVRVTDDGGELLGKALTQYVDSKDEIPAATKEVVRWLDKLGYPGLMGDRSRDRTAGSEG